MQIRSDFKDFYDAGMSLGMDPTMIYDRRKQTIPAPVHFGWVNSSTGLYSAYDFAGRYYTPKLTIINHIIGFCGKLHLCMEVNTKSTAFYSSKEDRATRAFCYKVEDVDTYVKKNFKDEEYQDYLNTAPYDRENKGEWPFGQRRKSFEKTFEDFERHNTHSSLFEKYRCPVFRAYGEGHVKQFVVINECLKPFDFIKVVGDPYTAYQQIAMFFGNMAEPRKPIPKLDDEVMREIKGFTKESFRKPKSSEKRNKNS